MDHDTLLTTDELAEVLKVPPSTVRRWRMEGRGPAVTWISTRRARYRWSDVTRWLGGQSFPPGERPLG